MASACYVYTIVGRVDAKLPHNLTGLKGEPLTLVPWRALAAVTSATEASRVEPRAALLVRHEAVVEVISQIMPALPMRFGAVLPNAVAVAQAIEERYDSLLADLTRVGGKQEIGVTVLWGSGEDSIEQDSIDTTYKNLAGAENFSADEQGRGTRYLLARKDAYRRDQAALDKAKAVVADLDAFLRPYVHESRYAIHAQPRINVRAAYLLAPETFKQVQDALARYQDQHDTLRLLVTGPWPPYSFVGLSSGSGALANERLNTYGGFPLGT